jgi:hypothetical protein
MLAETCVTEQNAFIEFVINKQKSRPAQLKIRLNGVMQQREVLLYFICRLSAQARGFYFLLLCVY